MSRTGAVEVGLDFSSEVAFPLEVDLPGDLDRDPKMDRELDRQMRAFLVIEAPDEADVVVRLRNNREARRVFAVVGDAEVVQARKPRLLIAGDGDVVEVTPRPEQR